jgi:hypothetical protein
MFLSMSPLSNPLKTVTSRQVKIALQESSPRGATEFRDMGPVDVFRADGGRSEPNFRVLSV